MHNLTRLFILLSFVGAVFWAIALPYFWRRQSRRKRMSPWHSSSLVTRAVLLGAACVLVLAWVGHRHGMRFLLAPYWRPGPSASWSRS